MSEKKDLFDFDERGSDHHEASNLSTEPTPPLNSLQKRRFFGV